MPNLPASKDKIKYYILSTKPDGNCFFESIAIGLNKLQKDKTFTIQDLRNICSEFFQKNKIIERNEVLKKRIFYEYNRYKFINSSDPEEYEKRKKTFDSKSREIIKKQNLAIENAIENYIKDIKNDIENPIWGRPNIEGQMICYYLKDNKITTCQKKEINIHVLEIQKIESKKVKCHELISAKDGVRNTSDDNNAISNIHIINNGKNHFDALDLIINGEKPNLNVENSPFNETNTLIFQHNVPLDLKDLDPFLNKIFFYEKKKQELKALVQDVINFSLGSEVFSAIYEKVDNKERVKNLLDLYLDTFNMNYTDKINENISIIEKHIEFFISNDSETVDLTKNKKYSKLSDENKKEVDKAIEEIKKLSETNNDVVIITTRKLIIENLIKCSPILSSQISELEKIALFYKKENIVKKLEKIHFLFKDLNISSEVAHFYEMIMWNLILDLQEKKIDFEKYIQNEIKSNDLLMKKHNADVEICVKNNPNWPIIKAANKFIESNSKENELVEKLKDGLEKEEYKTVLELLQKHNVDVESCVKNNSNWSIIETANKFIESNSKKMNL